MPRRTPRVYWREVGGVQRAYGDFRDFADVLPRTAKGHPKGARRGLIPPGAKQPTTDPDVAAELAAQHVRELEDRRRRKVLLGVSETTALGPFVEYHVRERAGAQLSDFWTDQTARMLGIALDFFGHRRDINSITVQDVQGLPEPSPEAAQWSWGDTVGWEPATLPERSLQPLQEGHERGAGHLQPGCSVDEQATGGG